MNSARLLHIHLAAPGPGPAGALETVRAAWDDPDPALARLGAASGEALAVALLLGRARRAPGREPPFVLAVGDAVRRGLATASRATVAARAPLSGLFADGQVGGDLGRRLAAITDGLVLEGRAPAGSFLVLEEDGSAHLVSPPWAPAAAPAERIAAAAAALGPGASLVVGPAAEAGLSAANLASGSPTSFVGRGGLGAALWRRGLVGLLVRAEPVPELRGGGLLATLSSSPRLRSRAEGGTLELLHAFAARGDLEGLDGAGGARLAREARERGRERHGCRGCPTPCGWVFESRGGERQGARFNAVQALGGGLGLARFEDSLALLGRCDRLGIDAREAGALLELALRARERGLLPGPAARGDVEALLALLEALVRDPRAAAGAEALASSLGLEAPGPRVRAQAVRAESSLASLLGQCASARGADPMRSASHVLLDGGGREALARLVAPLALPPGAEDPLDPAGKGRLVAWTEALSAAVDATGFCAFSAGALLADGLVDLDQLAAWILPAGWGGEGAPGRRLLALGASIALAARELEQHLGAPPDVDRPAWARQRLDRPGMLGEYRLLRGLDGEGRPRPAALAALGSEDLLVLGERALGVRAPARGEGPAPAAERARGEAPAARIVRGAGRRGVVLLRAVGSLGDALAELAAGDEPRLELDLPAPLREVLEALVRRLPAAGPWLGSGGRSSALAYRAGRRLSPGDAVHDGDRLDLVVAIGGG